MSQAAVTTRMDCQFALDADSWYGYDKVYITRLWKRTRSGWWISLEVNESFDLGAAVKGYNGSSFLVCNRDLTNLHIIESDNHSENLNDYDVLLYWGDNNGFIGGKLFYDYVAKTFNLNRIPRFRLVDVTWKENGSCYNEYGEYVSGYPQYTCSEPIPLVKGDWVDVQVVGFGLAYLALVEDNGDVTPYLTMGIAWSQLENVRLKFRIPKTGNYVISTRKTENDFPCLGVCSDYEDKGVSLTKGGLCIVEMKNNGALFHSLDLSRETDGFFYNIDAQFTPASITKIMTLIIASEYNLPPTKRITIKASDIKDGSGNNLQAGDILTWQDLFLDVVLPSSNTGATAVARTIGEIILENEGESVSDSAAVARFVEEMNTKAQSLGMTNTHFDEPAGYPTTSTQLMSAKDACKMAMIASSKSEINNAWTVVSATINIYGSNTRTIQLTHDVEQDFFYGPYRFLGRKPGQITAMDTATLIGVVQSMRTGKVYAFGALNTTNSNDYNQFSTIGTALDSIDQEGYDIMNF